MVYDVQFIRRLDGKTVEVASDCIRLVGDTLLSVISQAEVLYDKVDVLPRPHGFRIREGGGEVIYEYLEPVEQLGR